MQPAPLPPPECDHYWKARDESFSHEFGTEIVVYFECEHCGATREYEDSDHDDGTDY